KFLLQDLKKLLKDNSISVRIESAKALSKFGDTSGIPVLLEIIRDRPKILQTDTAAKRALKLAKNLNRVQAIEAIGEIDGRSDTVLSLLRDIVRLKDEDAIVKDAAIVSLIKLGDREQARTFIYALSSSDVNLKAKACDVLGEVKVEEAKAKIGELLKHFSKDIRASACLALGKLSAKEYVAKIKELLSDKEEIVRIAACESLGMLGEKQYVDDLKKLLDDKNGFVRLASCNALLQLGSTTGRSFVISSLEAEDTDAVLKAVQILANFGDRPAIEPLENAFNKSQNELVKINIAGAILKIIKEVTR
ncbi:MAG: HEAT repeat domain-containing protein, partial [Elusimicrobiota bacterium]|nr:HEAT repeat domain-containing protein [Elusimicrobiota bacterium]